jgi:hypothetical protein
VWAFSLGKIGTFRLREIFGEIRNFPSQFPAEKGTILRYEKVEIFRRNFPPRKIQRALGVSLRARSEARYVHASATLRVRAAPAQRAECTITVSQCQCANISHVFAFHLITRRDGLLVHHPQYDGIFFLVFVARAFMY